MIRVVMFDLGSTLVDEQLHPFAHVPEALAAIAGFKTADGKALRTCLVSDFDMAELPATPAKVREIFQRYLSLLDQTGLRAHFEPVQKRVTLSTHAGQRKPARAVFEAALRRLRIDASLQDCLLVTEDAAHIKAVQKQLGMAALQFAGNGSATGRFDDWSQAPALINHLVAAQHEANIQAAIKVHLAAQGIEVATLERSASGYRASGHVWHCLKVSTAADLVGVHVAVPVGGKVMQGPRGALRCKLAAPTPSQIDEVTSFAHNLATQGQIAGAGTRRGAGGGASRGATHEITTAHNGQRRLVRKRFSAF